MGVQFEDYSIKVKKMIEEKALQFLYEAGFEIKNQASKNTKTGKGTGQTKKSWRFWVDKSSMSVKIGSTVEQAIWQELGTGEWAVNGDGRKGVWYVSIGSKDNQISPEIVKKYGFKIVHGKNGQEFAEMHGQRPTRPLHKAFRSSKRKLADRAKTLFGG